jgi:hypothetical protein
MTEEKPNVPMLDGHSLESLIARLKAEDPAKVVAVGFAEPHSYRGYYEDLAFEVRLDTTVGEMLAAAESAVGATYHGWKGGEYTMKGWTACWLVRSRGECGETIGSLLLDFMLGGVR